MTDEELLLSRRVVTRTGCWELEGQTHRRYGQIRGHRYAHRVAYALWIGPIPPGAYICHRCDNPPCFNPKHLFAGDARVNLFDAHRKGRWRPRPRKTECGRGHPFTEENTYINQRGARTCRACLTLAGDRYRAKTGPHVPMAERTHCPNGHPYEGDNLVVRGGRRTCRTCTRARTNAWHAANRDKINAARRRLKASDTQDKEAARRLAEAIG